MIVKNSKLIFLIIFALTISCNKNNRDKDSVDFERKVFNDIFIPTVDSTLIDMRAYLGFHYSDHQRDSIVKDTLSRVIAFNIENYKISNESKTKIPKKYKQINDSVWNFQAEKFNTSKYIFKKSSELSTENELIEWQKKYPKFSGELAFSKIHFNDKKDEGIFETTYYCGSKCGVGFLIDIQKKEDEWIITKIEQIWIS